MPTNIKAVLVYCLNLILTTFNIFNRYPMSFQVSFSEYVARPEFRSVINFPTNDVFDNIISILKVRNTKTTLTKSQKFQCLKKFLICEDNGVEVVKENTSGKIILKQENFLQIIQNYHDNIGKYFFFNILMLLLISQGIIPW